MDKSELTELKQLLYDLTYEQREAIIEYLEILTREA